MSFNNLNPDGSFNMLGTANLNTSGSFPGLVPGPMQAADLRRLTPEQLVQLQMINQQQIQQLTAQMVNIQMTGTTPGQTTSPVISPMMSPTSTTSIAGQHMFPPQFTIPTSPTGMPAQFLASPGYGNVNTGIPLSPTMDPAQNVPVNVSNTAFIQANGNNNNIPYNTVAYPNTLAGINAQLRGQAQVPAYNNNAISVNANGPQRNAVVPNNLPLQQKNAPRSSSNSTYSSSSTSTPQHSPGTTKKNENNQTRDQPDGPTYMHRPRQMMTSPPSGAPPPMSDTSSTTSSGAPPPMSDASSTTSSVSIPGSPHSVRSPDSTFSDASPGPTTPDYVGKIVVNGDIRSPTTIKPIQNKPLHMQTRYPQDKCYSCMKKVYPMEKIGPVRGVVYHKGCFRCKDCTTQLTLKNFFHSQSDSFDIAVYCKSHHPISSDKGSKLNSESFEIRSALNAPKTGTVLPESERVPVKNFHFDASSREIAHARKVPVANLQSGNKIRNAAWSKSKREVTIMPTGDVVRHDDVVPEYDPVSYGVFQVETNPDY